MEMEVMYILLLSKLYLQKENKINILGGKIQILCNFLNVLFVFLYRVN